MKRAYDINRISVAAGIMAFMLVLVMLFSSFFIAVHADHDCTGEDCPICACIQQCQNTIRTIGSGVMAVASVVLPLSIVLFFISSGVLSFQHDTPVSTKVRLND